MIRGEYICRNPIIPSGWKSVGRGVEQKIKTQDAYIHKAGCRARLKRVSGGPKMHLQMKKRLEILIAIKAGIAGSQTNLNRKCSPGSRIICAGRPRLVFPEKCLSECKVDARYSNPRSHCLAEVTQPRTHRPSLHRRACAQ